MNLFTLLALGELNPMNWEVIKPALHFLWKGLLAIFVVIGLIVITVKFTQFVITKAENAQKAREERKNQDEQQ